LKRLTLSQTKLEFDDLKVGAGLTQHLGEGPIDDALNSTAELVAQELVPNLAKEFVESTLEDVMTAEGKDTMQEFFENRVQEVVKTTPVSVIAAKMGTSGAVVTPAEVEVLSAILLYLTCC